MMLRRNWLTICLQTVFFQKNLTNLTNLLGDQGQSCHSVVLVVYLVIKEDSLLAKVARDCAEKMLFVVIHLSLGSCTK